MASATLKKVATPSKAPVVPTKKIATAASKVTEVNATVKAAVKAKPQTSVKTAVKVIKAAAKPATKSATKPATKSTTKPAAKTPVKAAAKPAASAVTAVPAKEKAKKAKLVRDSFTMPEAEYAVLNHVKKACLSAGIEVKKSQLLRVGLLLLSKTDVASLKTLVANLEPLKAGRPKKEK